MKAMKAIKTIKAHKKKRAKKRHASVSARAGGFQSTKVFAPLGDPSSDTTSSAASSKPHSCATCAAGADMVAEQARNCGASLP
jgi:hypothetical protein